MVPAPEVICAVMHACRKLNDYALAVRFLESAEVNLYFWGYSRGAQYYRYITI